MTEFYAAFVWGLGVSCGASIGCLVLIVMNLGLGRVSGRAKKYEQARAYDREVLVQLTERNELTGDTIGCLERIATAAEGYAESFGDRSSEEPEDVDETPCDEPQRPPEDMGSRRGTEVTPMDWGKEGVTE